MPPSKQDSDSQSKSELKVCSGSSELPASPPMCFKLPLKAAQLQTLGWMQRQEQGDGYISTQQVGLPFQFGRFELQAQVQRFYKWPRGGVCADQVGFGKTACAVALIASECIDAKFKCSANNPKPPSDLLPCRATLVVVPPNLLNQWEREFKKFLGVDLQGLKLIVISTVTHLRNLSVADIMVADVILCSIRLFSSLESYRPLLDDIARASNPKRKEHRTASQQLASKLAGWKARFTNVQKAKKKENPGGPEYTHEDFLREHPQIPKPKLEDFSDKDVDLEDFEDDYYDRRQHRLRNAVYQLRSSAEEESFAADPYPAASSCPEVMGAGDGSFTQALDEQSKRKSIRVDRHSSPASSSKVDSAGGRGAPAVNGSLDSLGKASDGVATSDAGGSEPADSRCPATQFSDLQPPDVATDVAHDAAPRRGRRRSSTEKEDPVSIEFGEQGDARRRSLPTKKRKHAMSTDVNLPALYKELHSPVLEMFWYHRLVIDEIHEACDIKAGTGSQDREKMLLYHSLRRLQAARVWGLTATPPLSCPEDVRVMSELLHIGPLMPNYCSAGTCILLEPDRQADYREAHKFVDHFLRRNTWDETSISVEHHFITVRHTRSERVLYLDEQNRCGHSARLLQLCTHFEPEKLEGAGGGAVNTLDATLQQHRQELEDLKQRTTAAEDAFDHLMRARALRQLTDGESQELDHYKRSLAQLKPNLRDKESAFAYFEGTIKALRVGMAAEEEMECSICLCEMTRTTIGILPCGHFFHAECVRDALRTLAPHCPKCRIAVPNIERDVLSLGEDIAEEEETDLTKARFGTKLAKVVEQARKIRESEPHAKCVVFVQWDALLIKVHEALAESGLPCLRLKGNIFSRQQTLRRFEESPAMEHAFLLLSLETSTSGMNLTVANHLFLVHPCLVGNRATAVACEQQAIGRLVRQGQTKTVHVHRFVTEGTIEETITMDHQAELYKEFQHAQASRQKTVSVSSAASSS
eukprot:TRINITY_DN13753_c0_g2_i3.p1 TRINITY_DN13753_c0_g2~~TRINITY_DN13753_c0_g2_i3.p1  ORF type:complete len:983 (-),score=147.32 TRINITY_DN13753_c0_g2_i3:343-3291(-)